MGEIQNRDGWSACRDDTLQRGDVPVSGPEIRQQDDRSAARSAHAEDRGESVRLKNAATRAQ
jgi:hypothetical protein